MFVIVLTKPSTKRRKYLSEGGSVATELLYHAATFETKDHAEFFLKNCTAFSLARIVEIK